MLIKHDVLLVCLLLSDWKLMTWAGWYSILKLDARRFLWQNIVRCQNRDCQRDSEEEREPQTGRGERQADMKEKWYSSEKGLSAVGRSITASHYADVNLAVRQEPQQRERDAGRESRRERAEVVGEADNMLSLCKLIEKWWWEKWRAAIEEGGDYVVELMWMWCRGIKTKSSSRTREQHTGREVIPCYRCIMHGLQ